MKSRKRKIREWVDKARRDDTCSQYKCTGKNFPYCAKHDAP